VAGPSVASAGGALGAKAASLAAQDDAVRLVWLGRGKATASIVGPAADLNRQLTGAFAPAIDWRVDTRPVGRVLLGFGDRNVDVTDRVAALPQAKVATLQVPMRCFAQLGVDVTRVGTPLAVTTDKVLAVTLARVRLEPITSAAAYPAAAK